MSDVRPDPDQSLQKPISSPMPVSLWGHFRVWLHHDTVIPSWFTGRWRHPVIGYFAALLAQILLLGITLMLIRLFPHFILPDIFMVLGTLFVALLWGAGPGLFAALLATLLLNFFILQPRFLASSRLTLWLIEIVVYLLAGCTISFLASRTTAARAEAESSRKDLERLVKQLEQEKAALAEAERTSTEQAGVLEAIIEAVPDALFFTDAQGRSVRMNAGGQSFLASNDTQSWQGKKVGEYLLVRDVQGRAVPSEEWPSARILRGEVLSADRSVELLLHRPDGSDRYVSMTGGPLRNAQQTITGAVTVIRDVTENYILMQRTQESLEALLLLAENLVQVGRELSGQDQHKGVAQYLVELIRNILHCDRASLTLVNPLTGAAQSLAVVGLSPEQEALWRLRQPGFNLQEQIESPMFKDRFLANEVVIIDMTKPPLNTRPNPFAITSILFAPLLLGNQLLGVLSLDYAGKDHTFTANEQALVKAIARFAALVIERERLLQERAEALANEVALRETNRLMDEFVGIAGHELRTPLTTIKASVQLANRQLHRMQQTNDYLPAEIRQQLSMIQGFLDRAERQTTMQNRLVNDLLDISRVQANRLELHQTLFDLSALVCETVEDQRHSSPERVIQLVLSSEDELIVMADIDRVRQVITNYLSNALKYSEMSKPVQVSLEKISFSVRVSVQDEGPGLSSLEQHHIWERFYRVEGVEVRSGSGVGLGLGLYICRTIIERQQGRVGVESAPGHGSTFWFTLPLAEYLHTAQ